MTRRPIPVILDTDIGTDIDDTWALAMLLRSGELDLKLVTVVTGDAVYRAKLAARFLDAAGRSDVAVGVGLSTAMPAAHRTQAPWAEPYDLARYPGGVRRDGVGALVETIMSSPEPPTLICIGPLDNVGAALAREPRIAERARFVGMLGSLRWSHDQKAGHGRIAEYNVKAAVAACQKALAAPWDKTITPLDTCGRVRLTGAKYAAVAGSRDPLAGAIIENYQIWKKCGGWVKEPGVSSILFDCVAVYLGFADELLVMERLGIRVADDGFMWEDAAGPSVNCATRWKDLPAFEDLLVSRLTEGDRPSPHSRRQPGPPGCGEGDD